MARGELRSTLSRACLCRCRRSRASNQEATINAITCIHSLGRIKKEFYSSLGFHYISRLAAANIGCASEKEKNKFSFSLGFHYICREWRFL